MSRKREKRGGGRGSRKEKKGRRKRRGRGSREKEKGRRRRRGILALELTDQRSSTHPQQKDCLFWEHWLLSHSLVSHTLVLPPPLLLEISVDQMGISHEPLDVAG